MLKTLTNSLNGQTKWWLQYICFQFHKVTKIEITNDHLIDIKIVEELFQVKFRKKPHMFLSKYHADMAWRTCQHGPDDIDCMYLIFPEGLINHPSLRRVLARILLVDLLLTQQHQKRQFINREIQNVIDEALVELELDEDWCKRVMEDFGDFPSKNFFSNLMPYVKRCNQPLYHRPLR